jgi:DNA-binding beta-propeller fold protein YncE
MRDADADDPSHEAAIFRATASGLASPTLSLIAGNAMTSKSIALTVLIAVIPIAGVAQPQPQPGGSYHVEKIQLVGGDGGFDYVTADPDGRNLFVARSGPAGHIGVFNLDTLAQVGDMAGVSAHGAAVDSATGHGFATSKPVTMFDARTFAVIKKIDVEGNPDGYLNDPYNHRFYVLSHSAPNITVIDDKDGSILGTIDIGGAPEQAATDGHGKIYVDIVDKAAIAVIDAGAMKMVGKYDLSSRGSGCAGLALDAKNGILFAACREKNNMVILSAVDGHIITDLPIGVGCDGASFNSVTMEAFTSQGDGTLTVVKENSTTDFAVEQTVLTPARAKTHTLDTKTGNLYLITAEFGPTPASPAPTSSPSGIVQPAVHLAPAAPAVGAPPQGPPSGGAPSGPPPAWRRNWAPMIPHSFQILVVGKD